MLVFSFLSKRLVYRFLRNTRQDMCFNISFVYQSWKIIPNKQILMLFQRTFTARYVWHAVTQPKMVDLVKTRRTGGEGVWLVRFFLFFFLVSKMISFIDESLCSKGDQKSRYKYAECLRSSVFYFLPILS